MTKLLSRAGVGLSLFMGLALLTGGCSQGDNKGGQAKDSGKDKGGQVAKADDKKDGESNHTGWWCDEHGVPEAECSMCSAKVAAEFKKKGDWCEKHDRAKSQCFICDPSLEAKYAARYEAKYGKKPPVPEDNRAKTEDGK